MALMTVFHGSGERVERPEIRIGRYTKDFGPGFCTDEALGCLSFVHCEEV